MCIRPPRRETAAAAVCRLSAGNVCTGAGTDTKGSRRNCRFGEFAAVQSRRTLSNLDGDTMLILAMMVMLYKDGGWDGCDKKLLMALAYLLT
ncbi:MAG: hypothetical protein ACLUOF_12240 [Ruminococcus sp.]